MADESSAAILANDRCLLVSSTGAGKSTLASWIFSRFHCQRLLVDPKGEWHLVGGVLVRDPRQLAEALDRHPLVRYVPTRSDRPELEALYEAAFRGRHDLVIWTDEVQNVCIDGWAPRHLRLIHTQGRALRVGHIACTTRPRRIARECLTEADHIFVFAQGLAVDDLTDIAREMSLTLEEIRQELEVLPDYGYLWFDRRRRKLLAAPPLPPSYITAARRVARKTM